jgi:hypothetical protein
LEPEMETKDRNRFDSSFLYKMGFIDEPFMLVQVMY